MMDLIGPVSIVLLAFALAALGGFIIGRKRPLAAPLPPRNEPATPLAAVVADQGVQLAAVKRQLSELEEATERRFRTLSGMVSAGRRKDRGGEPEQLELPPGPQRDAVIDKVLGSQAETYGRAAVVDEDDPTKWPMHLLSSTGSSRRR